MQQARFASALNITNTVCYTGKSCCVNTDNAHENILGAHALSEQGQ